MYCFVEHGAERSCGEAKGALSIALINMQLAYLCASSQMILLRELLQWRVAFGICTV